MFQKCRICPFLLKVDYVIFFQFIFSTLGTAFFLESTVGMKECPLNPEGQAVGGAWLLVACLFQYNTYSVWLNQVSNPIPALEAGTTELLSRNKWSIFDINEGFHTQYAYFRSSPTPRTPPPWTLGLKLENRELEPEEHPVHTEPVQSTELLASLYMMFT